jgi:cytochrome c oxidase assembly protein subunit 15
MFLAIKRVALFSILVTYLLIVFGGYVASSNSGMGCGPDWPLCNGLVIPNLKGATLIEFTHRLIGAVLLILTLSLFFMLSRANVDRDVRFVSRGMIGLLVVQVLLGAVVVVLDLPAIVVTIHLLIAMIYLFSLIWIWMKMAQKDLYHHTYSSLSAPLHKTIKNHFNVILVFLILTLVFGAYIKHQSYGLACGWLGCGDEILPVTVPQILQSIHRGLALISCVYIIVLAYLAFVKKWGASLQKRLALVAFTVLIQILIGVATIISVIDVSWAVLHLAVGTAVFAFMSEARIYLGSTMVKTSIKTYRESGYQSLD